MKEVEVKSIKAWQAFKVLALIFAICLLVMGLIVSSYGLVIGGFGKFLNGLMGTAILTFLMAPVYAFIAVIIIWLYNLIAKLVGGIKVNIEE